jgi:hypothetical protein
MKGMTFWRAWMDKNSLATSYLDFSNANLARPISVESICERQGLLEMPIFRYESRRHSQGLWRSRLSRPLKLSFKNCVYAWIRFLPRSSLFEFSNPLQFHLLFRANHGEDRANSLGTNSSSWIAGSCWRTRTIYKRRMRKAIRHCKCMSMVCFERFSRGGSCYKACPASRWCR